MIDRNAMVGHNARMGQRLLVNSGAHSSGSAVIADGARLEPEAVLLRAAKMADRAIVGTGAAVTAQVCTERSWLGFLLTGLE